MVNKIECRKTYKIGGINYIIMEQATPLLQQTNDQLVEQYLQSLSPLELQAYEIAKSHLGTSFNIVKSNGFINRGAKPP